MTHLTIPAKVVNDIIVSISLNEKESIAYDATKTGIESGYQTDEITEMVADALKCSINTAKGYIGKLAQKGIIKKERYFDKQIGWITQFSMNEKYL